LQQPLKKLGVEAEIKTTVMQMATPRPSGIQFKARRLRAYISSANPPGARISPQVWLDNL